MPSEHSRLTQTVNRHIYEVLNEVGSEDGDFLCECDDENCTQTIQLTLREYAARQGPGDGIFPCAPGHYMETA
ncbi:MAG TPA: hypothetical protein VE693_01015 [Gaiellaceae bacterium]|jgi:hypothetical protein|nr:hypothetical protein [Gaiellaceae bacterium]